jgi:iron-sulfur cluster insertion protein
MSDVGYNPTLGDAEIRISPTAAAQFRGLMQNADGGIEGIRIFVTGGGCGGMEYGMTYAEQQGPLDKVMEGDGFKLMVDAVALAYLKGCDVDYAETGLNPSFVFNNVFQSVGGSGGCSGCAGGGF